MNIEISSICQAFNSSCVGTKVTDRDAFMDELKVALAAFEMPTSGHGSLVLSSAVAPIVLSGDCRREGLTEDDYIVRQWRGEMMVFAKRREGLASFCVAIVYTIDAYLADPQVSESERDRVAGATHVLVAVLGSCGPKPTLSSSRFVRNLAGGNPDYAPGRKTNEELATEAASIVDYESKWVVVADPRQES